MSDEARSRTPTQYVTLLRRVEYHTNGILKEFREVEALRINPEKKSSTTHYETLDKFKQHEITS
ncbi:hypothetical protein T11_17566 [Trichinella zimbabwensis]|uniref:Uncharacterized protein n=1 Tax=Trichinella zimbabwensis TaxID=268475 RepID=A0A0V1GV75_9BILA|nr:hypothetical protein T11_17566 [Trichinella zimbabwensis]